jgi:hypothetical protein
VTVAVSMVLVGILMPALSQANQSAAKTKCQLNAKTVTEAALRYAMDHRNRTVPDLRAAGYTWVDGNTVPAKMPYDLDNPPKTFDDLRRSWFGQLEKTYLAGELDVVDCPVIDDHRRQGFLDAKTGQYTWPTDYSINRYGINVSLDLASEPSRNVMLGEPNMPRAFVTTITSCIAYYVWWGNGNREDLEQKKAGSLSFGFVDGHAVRVTVPNVKLPFFNEAYPEIATEYPTPTTNVMHAHGNLFLWNLSQSSTKQGLKPPNDLTSIEAY